MAIKTASALLTIKFDNVGQHGVRNVDMSLTEQCSGNVILHLEINQKSSIAER